MVSFLDIFTFACISVHAHATVERTAYRLQQFDLLGISRGTKASSLNGEAITWQALSTSKSGAGSVALLQWSEIEHLHDAISKGVSGVVLVLPSGRDKLTIEQKIELEHQLFQESLNVAVYLVEDSPEIREAIARGTRTNKGPFDFERLWSGTITQLTISSSAPVTIPRVRLPTLYGTLGGQGLEDGLPTIALVAHYDAFAAAPELAVGADSNGSGVAALLEILRIFSRVYTVGKSQPKANIVFVLSAGGKLNYQGIKKLIEDATESQNGDHPLADSKFTVCLDSIGSKAKLYAHVSKPPKAGHPMRSFLDTLNSTKDVDIVHKKINLAEEMRNWEHERFSLSKLAACTLSAHSTHNARSRLSLFDREIDMDALESNVNKIASAIGSSVFKVSKNVTDDLLEGSLGADRDHLEAVMDYLTSKPRSSQLIHSQTSAVVKTLQKMMAHFLPKDSVRVSHFTPDRREPEFVLYDQTKAQLHISEVKPVLFDLFLAGIIVVYLCVAYLVISRFGSVVRTLTPRREGRKVE